MKAFVVDTVVTVTFFTLVAGMTELFIAGMELHQVVVARLLTIPVMVLTGRPYGVWRDWVFVRTNPKQKLTTVLVDIIAFLTFQVPVYVATLIVAGARASEIQAAVSAAILFMVLLSRPFGLLLEWVRRQAGTEVEAPPSGRFTPAPR